MSCENGKESPSQIKVAVCLLFEKDGKILLVRQSPQTSKDPGLWGPPGGHVNFGETLQEAARREAKEEIGENIEIEIQHVLGTMEQIKEKSHLVLISYSCQILSGSINPGHEIDQYAWVSE
jgi:ADP-ribose pyrophosphatase YjhB (NUDIX family)